MRVDQFLVDAAVRQLDDRWPDRQPGLAAALYLEDGSVLTGVALPNINAVMNLCAETGPICEAFGRGERVVASVCVARRLGDDGFVVLAPCGACQERLALWGPDVEVGVAHPYDVRDWSSRRLAEVNPYYWAVAYGDAIGWPSVNDHIGR